MQPVLELIQIAQLVRTTARTIESALDNHIEAGTSEGLDSEAFWKAKAELGVAFQSLVRAADALDVVRPP